jgi:serine-type D-Ala-D-Ala carboxypeptidase/endopeptidase (penicillin-binding protein 4)
VPIVAAALAVAGVFCIGAGVRAVSEPAAAAAMRAQPALTTPLWSPRRVPAVFGAFEAVSNLRRQLAGVAAPESSCVTVDRGRDTIVGIGDGRALAGASTQKLLVAAASLAIMGPDHRFETRAVASDPVRGGALPGDLTIVGGGDPMLTTAATPSTAADPHTALDALADAIAHAGIHRIDGALIADDTRFDRERSVPSWGPTDVADGEVGALGALIVNGGRADNGLADPQPALTTVRELATLLTARGIEVAGGVRDPGRAASKSARTVARIESPPLRQIVEQMLTASNNETAEMLTRQVGFVESGTGTTAAGTRAIPIVLSHLGIPVDRVDLHDGSGLSADDRVTCAALISAVALGGPRFAPILDGLAVAGESGTLAGRFAGTTLAGRLHAKTGHINGVVGLAGVIETAAAASNGRAQPPRGRVGARFSFLANGNFSTSDGERLQDRIATAVAAYVDQPAVPDPLPAPH